MIRRSPRRSSTPWPSAPPNASTSGTPAELAGGLALEVTAGGAGKTYDVVCETGRVGETMRAFEPRLLGGDRRQTGGAAQRTAERAVEGRGGFGARGGRFFARLKRL